MAKKSCDCDSKGMTLQQWAAAGGDVPKSFKGREKSWANQVKKFSAGGDVNMQAGGVAKLARMLKGTQEALPAAQREANLQRMLAESKAPMRLYHGTMATEGGKGQEAIRRIKPSKEGALGSGVYLTPQSEFASTYAGFPARSQLERDIETGSDFAKKSARQLIDRMDRGVVEPHEVGGNMLPVYAQIKNPLILDGSMGRDPMVEALVKLGMDKDAAGRMVENAYERKGYIGKEVESRARAAGYDGLMQYRDGNLTEVVSYNPNAVKSATGNVGTFDVTNPDLSKAGGGLIKGAIKAIKGTQKVLPAVEREANLQKMLEDSAIKDRVYHGTNADIRRFSDKKLGKNTDSNASSEGYAQTSRVGHWFSTKPMGDSPEMSKAGYTVDMPAYLSIKNPKREMSLDWLAQGLESKKGRAYRRELEKQGYDGIVLPDEEFGGESWVAFRPEQIKSAIGNRGTYDTTNPDMNKAKGGEVKMQEGGAAFGVFPHMKRKRTKQDPEAAKNVPVDLARGFVAGALGMPGDIESLARLPYELITGNESPTILPTSGDIEKRLPFKSDTPVSRLATEAGQLGGGFYTGPGSGARAAMAVPKAIKRAGQDFVMAAPQGAPRMFIGPKAKTWDQAKANTALKMEREGRDPVDIWRETGTFRSADGVLRQEISDVGAIHRNPTQLKELGKQKKEEAAELQQRLAGIPGQKDMFPKALTEARRPVREKVKTLKEEVDELMRYSDVRGQRAKFALEHPELYKAYPELAEIPVYQGGSGFGSERASLRGGPQDMRMEITQSGLRGDPRSSALHEMQHAIQTIEEMGPGGSPTFAFKDPKAYEILEELRKKALEPMSFEEYAKQYSHVPDLQRGYESYKGSIPRIVKNMDRELQQQAAMEYYKRLAGEAEARATQAREPMSASQRAQEFPYSSYDVLPEDLIVKAPKSGGLSLQTVYHGSPHKFDKFDASKIGTGEGAQAYGHGLYFAESPGVASDYKRKLSDTLNVSGDATDLERRAAQMALTFGDNTSEGAINWLSKYEGKGAEHTSPALTPELIQSVKQKFSEGTFSPGGHLYTVDLPDEKIARMIDWDKPLSEQPEVIKALKGTDYEVGMSQKQAEKVADQRLREEADEWAEMTGGDPVDFINNADWEKYVDQVRKESGSVDSSVTGKDLHRMIMRDEGYRPDLFDTENYQVSTSEALRGYGIPGVKYLDATSRQAGEGTRNFVVFPGEEDALTILERKKEGGEVGMKEGGAAFGRYTTGKKYQGAVKRAKEADVNTLADPRTYAFVSGLLGEAPDQLGFSAMHPDYQGIQKAGEKGFTGGTILGVAPLMGPLTKNLPVGASIKPKGGNWLTGSVEKAVQPLKRYDLPDLFPELGPPPPNSAANEALNQWIDRNLTNYIKKEMATPEDPVRRLAEQGVVHIPSEQVGINRYKAPEKRSLYGGEQLGQSEAAKAWEDASDVAINAPFAGQMAYPSMLEKNPWLSKLDPQERVYALNTPASGNQEISGLGFDHIVDVLKQDLAAGRIRPEQLSKVSMEQAVRRTYDFDQDMAKKMREAQIKATEGMPVHKEYPEGYKWVELTAKYPEQIPEGFGNVQNFPKAIKVEKIDAPGTFIHGSDMNDLIRGIYKQFPETKGNPEKALEAALKYEGETMGHCVGGYCPDVLAGRSRIYSLRDAKGEPHVTIETKPGRQWNERSGIFYDNPELEPSWAEFSKGVNQEARSKGVQRPSNYILEYPNWLMKNKPEIFEKYKSIFDPQPFSIAQIKGKQNKAPKEEYLPFVQDFVKSGQWSDVGDFSNTGLIRRGNVFTPTEKQGLIDLGQDVPEYLTREDIARLRRARGDLPPGEGMKAGGEVKMQAGGAASVVKNLLGIGQKGKGAAKSLTQAEKNALRSQGLGVPGEDFADVMNPADVMRMSEALGNAGAEGKTLNLTQADRSRVFGANKGGTGFSGLQLTSPAHQQAGTTWGVGKPSHVTRLINANTPDTIWTTFIGSPTQHMSNPVTVERMYEAHKKAKPSAALIEKMNKQINGAVNPKTGKPVFSEPIDISDPASLAKAQTFDQRKVLAQAMTMGGEKKGEKATQEAFRIVREETDPLLVESPTYAVGNRLWTIDKDAGIYRPDLNAAFPYQVVGTDLGLVYNPAPIELAAPEFFGKFANRLNKSGKPQPMGHKDLTATTPKQLVDYEYLTNLQKAGYAKGGKVGGLSQAKNQRKK